MITNSQRLKLIAAKNRLVAAEVADSWKGGGDPLDAPEIELELERARTAFDSLLSRMEKPSPDEDNSKRFQVFRQALLENEVWAYELVEKAMSQFNSIQQFDAEIDRYRPRGS